MAASTVAIGVSVLCGWTLRIAFLQNPFPDEPPVAVSTAICFLLTGSSILLLNFGRKFAAGVLSVLSFGIASCILSHYLFASFDLDQVFNGSQSLGPLGPNRMSPTILFSFLAVNLASLLDHKRFQHWVNFLVLFSNVLCITAFSAHLYEVPKLMHVKTIIQMASFSSIAGLLMSWSLLCLHPRSGVLSTLCSDGVGGRFARIYLVPSVLLPFAIGKLVLIGELRGFYDSSLGTAIAVLLLVCCLVSMIWRVAGWLDDAEKEKGKAETDMLNSLESNRLIVETATEAFMMVDTAGKVVDWNPGAEQMLGWTRDEALGKNFGFVIAESERESRLKELSEYRRSGVSPALNARIEFSMLRKDGTEFPAEGSPFSVIVQGQERLCAFIQDISARKEAERRINEFVSTVSHELRTPLTSIKGALRLMEGGLAGELPAEALTLVTVASSETERLVRIVNDILDLKKIEAGKLELKFEDVELETLVDVALEGIRTMANDFGIELAKSIHVGGLLYCDRDRIIQVLNNLLSNAIKFSPEGETVTLGLESVAPNLLRFTVSDNGSGIPENQAHKLFGRFQQLDSSDTRQQGGTGLGLAISKAIVEQHHGRIGFETSSGEGSTFWFELPFDLKQVAAPSRN